MKFKGLVDRGQNDGEMMINGLILVDIVIKRGRPPTWLIRG